MSEDKLRIKYVDDVTVTLAQETFMIGMPLNFPLINPDCKGRLNDLEQYVEAHDTKLNTIKTKVIPFNFSRKNYFEPKISLGGSDLEIVYKTKLLGVICTSDCKWNENTKHIVRKANTKMCFFRSKGSRSLKRNLAGHLQIVHSLPLGVLCSTLVWESIQQVLSRPRACTEDSLKDISRPHVWIL